LWCGNTNLIRKPYSSTTTISRSIRWSFCFLYGYFYLTLFMLLSWSCFILLVMLFIFFFFSRCSGRASLSLGWGVMIYIFCGCNHKSFSRHLYYYIYIYWLLLLFSCCLLCVVDFSFPVIYMWWTFPFLSYVCDGRFHILFLIVFYGFFRYHSSSMGFSMIWGFPLWYPLYIYSSYLVTVCVWYRRDTEIKRSWFKI